MACSTVADHHLFAKLETQGRGIETGLRENGPGPAHHVGLHEESVRDVDRDPEGRILGESPVPLDELPAGVLDRPPPDGVRQTRFLGDGKKLPGLEQAPFGVIPPHQSLESDHPAAIEGHDGLVVHDELVTIDRMAQARFPAA